MIRGKNIIYYFQTFDYDIRKGIHSQILKVFDLKTTVHLSTEFMMSKNSIFGRIDSCKLYSIISYFVNLEFDVLELALSSSSTFWSVMWASGEY